jgi:branched-chain amino acid transport system permease protein
VTAFLQLAFAGFALGAVYGLVALGFVVVYQATGVINFAQGSLVLLGAYLASNATRTWQLPFPAAVVVAMALCAGFGVLVERLVLRHLAGQPVHAAIMATIGVLVVVEPAVTAVWGFDRLPLGDPWGLSTVRVAGVALALKDLWALALAAAAAGGCALLSRRTLTGLAMRAAAADAEAAAAQGISPRRVVGCAWAVSGAVAALAGVLLSAGAPGARPDLGQVALLAFPAVILGGLESPAGALAGGLAIGLVETLTAGYQPAHLPWLGSGFSLVAPYLVLVAVLVARPQGLFGAGEGRRA